MVKKVKAEGKVLLDELLSIRQLLDDELQGNDAPSDNIPILHDVDIELLDYDPATEPVANESIPAKTVTESAFTPAGKPATRPVNQPSNKPSNKTVGAEENPLIKRANAAVRRNIKHTDRLLKPLTRDMLGDNPFLPQKALDRLNANKVPPPPPKNLATGKGESLTDLLQGFGDLSPEQQVHIRELLEQKSEDIVEELVKGTLPRLERELRHRLHQQLDSLLLTPDGD